MSQDQYQCIVLGLAAYAMISIFAVFATAWISDMRAARLKKQVDERIDKLEWLLIGRPTSDGDPVQEELFRRAGEYCNAIQAGGVGCEQALALRAKYAGDREFIRAADVWDRVRTNLEKAFGRRDGKP